MWWFVGMIFQSMDDKSYICQAMLSINIRFGRSMISLREDSQREDCLDGIQKEITQLLNI